MNAVSRNDRSNSRLIIGLEVAVAKLAHARTPETFDTPHMVEVRYLLRISAIPSRYLVTSKSGKRAANLEESKML